MAVALEVQHLSFGILGFDDNEVVTIAQREIQDNVEQMAQTGGISVTYIGQDRFEWDIVFSVFYRATLTKLHQIWTLQDSFTLRPLRIESPLSSYTARWMEREFMERFVRGRALATWEYPVLWKEIVTGSCPEILVS